MTNEEARIERRLAVEQFIREMVVSAMGVADELEFDIDHGDARGDFSAGFVRKEVMEFAKRLKLGMK